MQIMVLDDNEMILNMVTTMLHSAYGPDNCHVIAARNGEEGLALLQERGVHPDLILTNLRMPQMDGLTFLSEVRHNAAWDGIRLVMMSALTSNDIVNEAAAGGAQAFLRKPFTYRDLMAIINNMLTS